MTNSGSTSFETFLKQARRFNVATVERTLWLDTETPVSLYLKSSAGTSYSFLFESVEGGRSLGRYSLIGFDPVAVVSVRDGRVAFDVLRDKGAIAQTVFRTNATPMEGVYSVVEAFRCEPSTNRPRFAGGWVGHFGYDTIRYVERISLPAKNLDPGQPEILLALYTEGIVVDNVLRGVTLFCNALIDPNRRSDEIIRQQYDDCLSTLEAVEKRVLGPLPASEKESPGGPIDRASATTPSEFESWVRGAKNYIEAGDIFQVVLSRRETIRSVRRPFDVYRSLRRINPSPYMYYLAYDGRAIIGSSPEMLIRVENGSMQTRPIAGTRPRAESTVAEKQMEQALREDEKEKAEHLMLVDLSRNDLGRVCEPGSVRVEEFMAIEKFSHVMHMCSTVTGTLRRGVTSLQALNACFPAGTLSGAPKIRAMQIISEYEPVRRGVYGGAVGYVDFSGNLDTCIAIRTIVFGDGVYTLQAGAGIVQDSVPEREYQETVDKMAALVAALED